MLSALLGVGSKLFKEKKLSSGRESSDAGKKIAKNKFLNIKDKKKDADPIKEGMVKPPRISAEKLLPQSKINNLLKETKTDNNKTKGGDIKGIFGEINSSLNDIIKYLKSDNENKNKQKERQRVESQRAANKVRENELEDKTDKFGFLRNISLPNDPFNIVGYFRSILIGALVLAVLKNLDKIVNFFRNAYKAFEEFITLLGEFLSPVWDGLKWITNEGVKIIAEIMGVPKEDIDADNLSKNLTEIAKLIPGMEQLFNNIKSAVDSLDTNSSSSSSPRSSYAKAGEIPSEVIQDTEFTQGVTNLAKKYNVPEDYLYAVMGFETGGTFDPAEKNRAGSGATGLIQFMDSTAEELGTTTDKLAGMSRSEQLVYVDKYFSGKGIEGGNLGDIYMAVLFPAAVGKPDDFVLFGKGALPKYTGKAYEQNKGLDKNGDGSITRGEAVESVLKYLPKNSVPSNIPEYDKNKKYKVGDVVMKNGKTVKFDGFGWAEVQGITSQNLGGGQAPAAPAPVPEPPAAPAAPAQVIPLEPKASSSVSGISERAEYEMPAGSSQVFLMPQQSGGNIIVSGGGEMMPPIMGPKKIDILNSLYQAQLIGFLYKQG
jgi:hypothetical protein